MRDKDFCGVVTNVGLRGLRPLLESWLEVLCCYSKTMQGADNAWWHNERATLSTLAGAAWRKADNGWIAIEECCTEKRGIVPEGNVDSGESKPGSGRCDLFVSHKSTDFAIEAKQAWQPIGKRAKKDAVQKAKVSAWKDAGRLMADEAAKRVAAVFVVPYLPVSEVAQNPSAHKKVVDRDLVRERVAEWFAQLPLDDQHAHAFLFPRRCEQFVSVHNAIFPGVVLMLRERKHGG